MTADRILDARQILRVHDATAIKQKINSILGQAGVWRRRDTRPVLAYINWGRWVADCPECCGGIACWDELPRGTCPDCGGEYDVTWPDPQVRAAAEAVLLRRPRTRNRNWTPWEETVDRLEAEVI